MRQSELFTKTRRDAPKDEVAKNAQLLVRAGYIHKEMAGAYAYLPLGLRTFDNIVRIIREEMDAIGGQEITLTALQSPALWEQTGRWSDDAVDIWFKTALKDGADVGLGFTHEEPLTALMAEYVESYKDLPKYVYQFQTKFRNELRAKSGIIGQRRVKMQDNYELSMMVGLDELYGLGYDFFQTMDDKYGAVTLDEIKRVANQYFNNKPHAVVVVTPSQEKK